MEPCFLAGTDRFFIHVPKNAGTAIVKQLGSGPVGHHITIRNVPPSHRHLALAVVRNPYDRVISLYNYCKTLNSYWHSEKDPPPLYDYCSTHTFEEFVRDLCSGAFENTDWHFKPQWFWLIDERGKMACEYIKFENLESELSRVLGKPINLDKINHTTRTYEHTPYTKRMVYSYFLPEFLMFYPEERNLDIKILKSNPDYRLGDILLKRGYKWQDSMEKVLSNEKYRNTILYKHLKGEDLKDLISKSNYPKPEPDELVIHVRAGDVVVHDWFLKKDYKSIISKFDKVTFVICYQYGDYVERGLWLYTDDKQQKNEEMFYEMLRDVVGTFPYKKFKIVSNEDADKDLVYMASSLNFIKDEGGFSDIIHYIVQTTKKIVTVDWCAPTLDIIDHLVKVPVNKNILVYSVFGQKNKTLRGFDTRIFYTGEYWGEHTFDDPNADLVIGYLPSDDRHVQVLNHERLHLRIDLYKHLCDNWKYRPKKKFCCFVVSNPDCNIRNYIFQQLSKYKHVDSMGKFAKNCTILDNIKSYSSQEYYDIISEYKFIICCENKSRDFYITEKIYNAFRSGTVPIYWGAPNVTDKFNEKTFIHVRNDNIEESLERVKHIDSNMEEYIKMFDYAPVHDYIKEDERIKKSFDKIKWMLQS